MNSNVINFPLGDLPLVLRHQPFRRRPLMIRAANSKVATVQQVGNSCKKFGILDGDTLILNLQFQESDITQADNLVVARLPDGRYIVKRGRDLKYEPDRIFGVVMLALGS
jgi:hypothetical protein